MKRNRNRNRGGKVVAASSGAAKVTFTDPFTGIDGATPDARWTQSVAGWTIQGNALSFGGAAYSFIFATCTAGDNTFSADTSFSASNGFGAIAIRYVDDLNFVEVRANGGNSEKLEIVEVVAGVATNTIVDPGAARTSASVANVSISTVGTTCTVTVTGGANPGNFSGTITNFATATKVALGMNTAKTLNTFDNAVLA